MLIRDTAGQEEYARLRPLAYSNADIFIIAFSVSEPSTFINAVKKVISNIRSGILKLMGFRQSLYSHLLETK